MPFDPEIKKALSFSSLLNVIHILISKKMGFILACSCTYQLSCFAYSQSSTAVPQPSSSSCSLPSAPQIVPLLFPCCVCIDMFIHICVHIDYIYAHRYVYTCTHRHIYLNIDPEGVLLSLKFSVA